MSSAAVRAPGRAFSRRWCSTRLAIKRKSTARGPTAQPPPSRACYESIVMYALDWHAIVISHIEIDALGLHV